MRFRQRQRRVANCFIAHMIGTQKRRSECAGQSPLAASVRSDKEVRMHRCAHGGAEFGDRRVLSDHGPPQIDAGGFGGKRRKVGRCVHTCSCSRSVTAADTAFATSSMPGVPSMTTQRSGSAAACVWNPVLTAA